MDEGKATEPCQAGRFNVNNIPERVTIMYYLNHYVNCGKNSHIVWQANFFLCWFPFKKTTISFRKEYK